MSSSTTQTFMYWLSETTPERWEKENQTEMPKSIGETLS